MDKGEGERRQSSRKGQTQSALFPLSPQSHDPLGDKRDGWRDGREGGKRKDQIIRQAEVKGHSGGQSESTEPERRGEKRLGEERRGEKRLGEERRGEERRGEERRGRVRDESKVLTA